MPHVIALFKKGKKNTPMIPLDSAALIAGRGVSGSRGGRPNGKRQVLVMPVEILDEFGLEPGILREQITTRGIDVMALDRGDQLAIGDALLEATGCCKPCEYVDGLRSGLREEMEDCRGMLFRVLKDGDIQRGDVVAAVPQAE